MSTEAEEHLLQELEKHTPEQRVEYAKILTGSAAAAPRDKDSLGRETKIALDKAKQEVWFNSGVRAKQRGYGNFSPFYENVTADYFFKCGYDGVSFVEAQQVLKDKLEQILKQDSTVLETVNELVDQNEPKSTDFLP